MLLATCSLVGIFVTLYLTLFKLGYIGEMTCAVGACETVQLSRWATFLGLPVAVWGVGFYATLFVLSLAGVQDRFAASRAISVAMVALTGWGLLFSLWLTYLELFVIQAICMWCVVSAAIVAVMFVLSLADLRAHQPGAAAARGFGLPAPE